MFGKLLDTVTEIAVDTARTTASLPGRTIELAVKIPTAVVDGLGDGLEKAGEAMEKESPK